MDYQLFYQINHLAGRWPILDQIGVFLAGDVFVTGWISAIILMGLFRGRRRQNVYLALVSAVISRGVVAEILKRSINRPRPYELLNVHQLIADSERGMSFPSGHAVIYFSLAFAFFRTKYFWPFLILAIIGSLARVFVGIHYPADILAGALIGIFVSFFFNSFFKT